MIESILHSVIKRLNICKIETTSLLIEYFKEQGFNKFKAPELAENELNSFLGYVNNQIDYHNKKGIICLFQPSTNKNVTCLDFGFFEIQKIKSKLLTEITDRQFEYVGANILKRCFNAVTAKANKGTSDGGYDFFGIINQKEGKDRNSIVNIEVYGQSKQYGANIDRPQIDKFVGFIERKKQETKYRPVLYIFATTSDYSSAAYEFATDYGILCLDGMQLASMIYRQILRDGTTVDVGFNDFIEEI
jgi:hypothetical protein